MFGCSIPRIFHQGSSEVKEPVKVYKWDGTAVKNALDDAVKVSRLGRERLPRLPGR